MKKWNLIFTLITFSLLFTQEDIQLELANLDSTDEYYIIEPFIVHQCEAVTDILYLEASTPELEDVIRLEDDYGREGSSEP